MIDNRDHRVWDVAQGKPVPAENRRQQHRNSAAGRNQLQKQNHSRLADDEVKTLKLPEGYEVNLFASEEQFPDLQKPVAMTFDAKGRLWVTTMPVVSALRAGQTAQRQDSDLRRHQRRRQSRHVQGLRRQLVPADWASSSASAKCSSASSRT